MSADSITFLGHGAVPIAEPASFDQMIRAETDCRLVTVRATIRAADRKLSPEAPVSYMRLQMLTDGGYLDRRCGRRRCHRSRRACWMPKWK